MSDETLETPRAPISVEHLVAPTQEECDEIKELTLKRLEEFGFRTIPELDYDLDNLAHEYIEGGGAIFVAKTNDRVVGSIMVRNIKKGVGEVKRFQIYPEYRGTGTGKKLLNDALSFMRQNGFSKAVLDTTDKSVEAVHLFKTAGFEEVKRKNNQVFFEMNLK